MEVYEKRNDESQIDYIKRVTSLREEYDLSYSQWCTLVCGASYSEDNSRKAYYVVEKMLPLIDYQISIDDAKVKKYNDLKSREIQISKEKEKLKDVKREYFNLVRNESRWEELYDTIMNKLEHMNQDHTINIYPYEINGEETEAILCLSDFHIGVEIDTPVNTLRRSFSTYALYSASEKAFFSPTHAFWVKSSNSAPISSGLPLPSTMVKSTATP